ncbi:hypothetical protein RN001_013496 [Aquatica leii]|uniref:CRAL-TRIO domain-containing protein n=1 Tax=Aquatica leii TaxID=1421715 RepID=A0AAN7P2J2_9COLE|nr:hypothetical protein RN001_013496 [Aquatica leii]
MAEYLQYDWKGNMLSRDLLQDLSFKKTKIDHASCVVGLRNLINKSTDAEFKNMQKQDDTTLLKFLYAKKFNVADAYQLLQNYYSYRKRNEDIFKKFSIHSSDILKALENGLPGVLSSRDRKGRTVLIMDTNNWDCSYNLISIYRSLLFTLEYLINDVCNQANGFVVIVDWTEFSFRQSMNLKPSILKLMIEGLQDCFPARFKGVHFIGQPWFVNTALTVIKPFLKDKMRERIYVHGNNLSTLHDYLPKDILPAEMGGEQPSYNPHNWLENLLSAENS